MTKKEKAEVLELLQTIVDAYKDPKGFVVKHNMGHDMSDSGTWVYPCCIGYMGGCAESAIKILQKER